MIFFVAIKVLFFLLLCSKRPVSVSCADGSSLFDELPNNGAWSLNEPLSASPSKSSKSYNVGFSVVHNLGDGLSQAPRHEEFQQASENGQQGSLFDELPNQGAMENSKSALTRNTRDSLFTLEAGGNVEYDIHKSKPTSEFNLAFLENALIPQVVNSVAKNIPLASAAAVPIPIPVPVLAPSSLQQPSITYGVPPSTRGYGSSHQYFHQKLPHRSQPWNHQRLPYPPSQSKLKEYHDRFNRSFQHVSASAAGPTVIVYANPDGTRTPNGVVAAHNVKHDPSDKGSKSEVHYHYHINQQNDQRHPHNHRPRPTQAPSSGSGWSTTASSRHHNHHGSRPTQRPSGGGWRSPGSSRRRRPYSRRRHPNRPSHHGHGHDHQHGNRPGHGHEHGNRPGHGHEHGNRPGHGHEHGNRPGHGHGHGNRPGHRPGHGHGEGWGSSHGGGSDNPDNGNQNGGGGDHPESPGPDNGGDNSDPDSGPENGDGNNEQGQDNEDSTEEDPDNQEGGGDNGGDSGSDNNGGGNGNQSGGGDNSGSNGGGDNSGGNGGQNGGGDNSGSNGGQNGGGSSGGGPYPPSGQPSSFRRGFHSSEEDHFTERQLFTNRKRHKSVADSISLTYERPPPQDAPTPPPSYGPPSPTYGPPSPTYGPPASPPAPPPADQPPVSEDKYHTTITLQTIPITRQVTEFVQVPNVVHQISTSSQGVAADQPLQDEAEPAPPSSGYGPPPSRGLKGRQHHFKGRQNPTATREHGYQAHLSKFLASTGLSNDNAHQHLSGQGRNRLSDLELLELLSGSGRLPQQSSPFLGPSFGNPLGGSSGGLFAASRGPLTNFRQVVPVLGPTNSGGTSTDEALREIIREQRYQNILTDLRSRLREESKSADRARSDYRSLFSKGALLLSALTLLPSVVSPFASATAAAGTTSSVANYMLPLIPTGRRKRDVTQQSGIVPHFEEFERCLSVRTRPGAGALSNGTFTPDIDWLNCAEALTGMERCGSNPVNPPQLILTLVTCPPDQLQMNSLAVMTQIKLELSKYLRAEMLIRNSRCLQHELCDNMKEVMKISAEMREPKLLHSYLNSFGETNRNPWISQVIDAFNKNACDMFLCSKKP